MPTLHIQEGPRQQVDDVTERRQDEWWQMAM